MLVISYLRNAKKTAATRHRKATPWFQCRGWPLKTRVTMTVKTVRETTSWIIFSWTRLNGPPFSLNPILFAGTRNQYSKKAIPQDIRTIRTSGQSVLIFISCNFRCPYQANVMRMLEQTSRRTVRRPFISKNNVIYSRLVMAMATIAIGHSHLMENQITGKTAFAALLVP